jgi:hypothetical protein
MCRGAPSQESQFTVSSHPTIVNFSSEAGFCRSVATSCQTLATAPIMLNTNGNVRRQSESNRICERDGSKVSSGDGPCDGNPDLLESSIHLASIIQSFDGPSSGRVPRFLNIRHTRRLSRINQARQKTMRASPSPSRVTRDELIPETGPAPKSEPGTEKKKTNGAARTRKLKTPTTTRTDLLIEPPARMAMKSFDHSPGTQNNSDLLHQIPQNLRPSDSILPQNSHSNWPSSSGARQACTGEINATNNNPAAISRNRQCRSAPILLRRLAL